MEIVSDRSREAMRKILREIQSGEFAREFIAERAGSPPLSPDEKAAGRARAERMIEYFEARGDARFAAFWREQIQIRFS